MINWFETLPSTHKYLVGLVREKKIDTPTLIGVDFQTDGIGSRGNSWIGEKGNLFFSFCVKEKHLPKDLNLASTSIYFAWIMKEVLSEKGSKTWLKWPNDFYIEDKKIGGVITTKIDEFVISSMGINLVKAPQEFGVLDIDTSPKELVGDFLKFLEKNFSWKQVFSKYKLEFERNKNYSFHVGGKRKSIADAKLCEDGSLELEKERVYSLR